MRPVRFRSLRCCLSSVVIVADRPDILQCGGARFRSGSIRKSLCKKYLPNSRVPCKYRLPPFGLGGGGVFGSTETRIWVDVSVSSSISRIARVPENYAERAAVRRPALTRGAFSFAEKPCELSRNPCFPATLRRLSGQAPGQQLACERDLLPVWVVAGNVREAGVIPRCCSKGAGCERERYSEVV